MRLLIFDLDGTLIDSKLDLAHAVNAMRSFMEKPPLEHTLIYSYVGDGAPVLVRRALGPEASDEEVERALEYFLAYYRDHKLDYTTLYPGVSWALQQLSSTGVQMAVLTNKPVRISREIIEDLGIGEHFVQVYGGNSFEQKKPNPIGIETLIGQTGVSKDETMMVGDSGVDMRTARNAGVVACGVTYGFQPESLRAETPDYILENMSELPELVNRISKPAGRVII